MAKAKTNLRIEPLEGVLAFTAPCGAVIRSSWRVLGMDSKCLSLYFDEIEVTNAGEEDGQTVPINITQGDGTDAPEIRTGSSGPMDTRHVRLCDEHFPGICVELWKLVK